MKFLRSFLLVVSFTLFSVSAFGQDTTRRDVFTNPWVGHSLNEVIDVRAKLIARYVKGNSYAWGVSVDCGDDALNGSSFYLAVYVYKDSVIPFVRDFGKFTNGMLEVDGVSVRVIEIERQNRGAK